MITIRRFVLILTMAAFVAFLSACGNGNDLDGNDLDGDGVANSADVDADGDGLIEIATAQQFNQIRYNLSGNSFKTSAAGTGDATGCGNGNDITACNGYELEADISLVGYPNWVPIGSCPNIIDIDTNRVACAPNSALFNGIFDGNGFTISDLTITSVGTDNIIGSGLFGAISPASILRNVHIRSANINGGINVVGMLVGTAIGASIMGSSAEGAINASGVAVGGLVGWGIDATITSSYAAGGSVSGTDSVGGLVGVGYQSRITSSYAAGGPVSGDSFVGGLIGDGEGSTIRSSYAAGGHVSGVDFVGGLVGDGTSSNIRSSYAASGSVNGNISVGGLVGSGSDAIITSSYTAGGAVSGTDSVGGLVGFGFNAIITSSYTAVGAVSGTDFVGGLVGFGSSDDMTYSYWDEETTGIDAGSFGFGSPQTTDELQGPETPIGIYVEWANDVCDDGTSAWNFGTAFQYPALNCTPGGLAPQRIQ